MTLLLDGRARGEIARWSLGFLIVLAAHGLIAWAVMNYRIEVPPAGGAPAIVIALEPLPVAPQEEQSDSAAGPQQMQTEPVPEPEPEPVKDVEPEPEKVEEEKPVEEPKPEPVKEPDPPPEPEPVQEAQREPEPTATIPPPVEEQIPLPEPPAEVTPEVALAPPPEPPPPQKEPEIKKPEVKPEKRVVRRKRKPRSVEATSAPSAAAAQAKRAEARFVGVARNSSMPSWKSSIVAHLQRHKRYPSDAQSRGATGTAVLAFTIDRSGRVIASRLARSSGDAALDQETMALIRRAQPLPAAPSDMVGARFSFAVPLRYNLR